MNKAKKIIAYVIMLAFITQWVPVVNTYAIEPINLENLNEVTADHGTTDSGAESAGSTDNVTTSGAVSGGLIDNGTTTDGGAVSGGSTDNGATTGSGAIGDGTAGHGTMDDVPPKNSNTLADIEPPNAPENLDYVINKNSITLTWSASTDNVGVIGYRIYNDNNYINTTSDLTYTISKDTEIKYFSVAAVDEAGNVSLKKSISISQDQDTEPPSQPTDLICVGKSDTEVGLLWTKSTDNYGVAGYYIYNGREIIGTTADSTYSITSLLDHTQYTFTVKAFDFAGNLSSVSNEVIVTTGLDVPENVVAIPDGTSIIVSWDEVYGAAYYDLMINDTLITDINTNSYTCEGLTQGKTYIIQVRAKSNANQKESASEINKQSDNIDLKTTAGWSATIEVDLNVSGTISEDTVWTAANSPYVLTNNIIISKGVTLTVEAGTVIESPSYRITVNGTLNANGTARSPVVFTTPDEATPDYWSYLSVGSTGVMNLNYTEVRYAGSSDYAIFSSGYANITNSKILYAEKGGASNSGEMNLDYTDIEALGNYGIYNTGKISVTNSSISGNDKRVIYVSTSGDVLLTDNQIIGIGKSESVGVYLNKCSGGNLTLSDNTITNAMYPVIVNLTYYNPTTATGLWDETIDGIGLTGNLTTNLTLPKKTYRLTESVTVNSDATLTIEAGTVIKSPSDKITVNGTLNANGTAESPVVFTTPDENTPDYWIGLSVGNTGTMNLNHTEVRYAGTIDYAIVSSGYANITNSKILYAQKRGVSNSGEMNLNYTDIEALDGYGIYNTGKISVTNSSISGNYNRVIYVSTSEDVLLTDNQIIGTGESGSVGIYLYRCSGGNLTLSNNTITDTIYPVIINLNFYNPATVLWDETIDDIGLTGDLATNLTLPKKTYQLTGSVAVNSGVTLTIEAGTVIESLLNSITVNGTLNANGTAESPVVFTTRDEATPTYWVGLVVNSTGVINLDYSKIRYAGALDYAAIKSSGQITITNSEISYSQTGIYHNSTIQPIIKYNSFLNNTNYALYNAKSSTMTIDATNNYWGSEDGPALYSSGTWSTDGGKISSGITYIPFLGNINAVSADLSYLSSTTPSDAITARVTVHNENVNANRSYFVEAYCSWDEETWYYKGGSEVTIPAGATSSDVDLQYSIYQTGNLHSKVIIYNDGGGTRLGESFKSDTDYVAVWYHFTIENPENTTEQYVSSVENINDPTYLILKQSDEELWKQYVLERNAWTDTGITYDVEPFTENWVLNGGSKSTSKNNLSTQSLNSNGLLNVLHITKTSTEIASEIIQNNAQYILDAAIMYGVDSKIVAGVIYAEQSLNVNILDNADYIVAFYGILDTSLGVGQVKMSTAKLLEDEGYVSKASASEGGWNIPIIGFIHGTETMAREKRLENDQQNIIYVAADLKYWQNMWEDEYPQISEDPAILGTLYNLGTRANAPNPNPQSNPFGEYVEENYDYMGDLLGLTEI